MQNLIDAAVAAASRNGVQAAVVLIGNNGAAAAADKFNREEREFDSSAWDQEVSALRTQLEAANTSLGQERNNIAVLQEQHKQELTHNNSTAQAAITNLEQRLAAAGTPSGGEPMQSDALARIAELEQALAAAQATPAPAPGTGTQPEAVAQFDAYGIEHLGLDSACEKLVRKQHETIGSLRTEFEALDTPEKTTAWSKQMKIKKDWLIAIGIALLGKAPSSAPRPSAPSAGGGVGGAPDVPEGHSDRPWMERLNTARAREKRMQEVNAQLEALRAAASTKYPAAVTKDGTEAAPTLKLNLLPPEAQKEREEIQVAENTYNVVRGQMIACCWSANLKPPADETGVKTIDDSLVAAGLSALAAPQPQAA